MEIAIRRQDVDGRPAMAVYVSGRCVGAGLSEQQAVAMMADLLNAQYAGATLERDR
ncbi:hypothetical protein [Microvirga thermotolerans]|uniref:hypothetical protein n=1 Tax=Microvirga thermotolerans TaxID=2651334 RepID=UPI0018839352|nr:hypothetical protein [Microvirga thermotolerans]